MTEALVRYPRLFASLVKVEHTVFALPFAYIGAFLAVGEVRVAPRPGSERSVFVRFRLRACHPTILLRLRCKEALEGRASELPRIPWMIRPDLWIADPGFRHGRHGGEQG